MVSASASAFYYAFPPCRPSELEFIAPNPPGNCPSGMRARVKLSFPSRWKRFQSHHKRLATQQMSLCVCPCQTCPAEQMPPAGLRVLGKYVVSFVIFFVFGSTIPPPVSHAHQTSQHSRLQCPDSNWGYRTISNLGLGLHRRSLGSWLHPTATRATTSPTRCARSRVGLSEVERRKRRSKQRGAGLSYHALHLLPFSSVQPPFLHKYNVTLDARNASRVGLITARPSHITIWLPQTPEPRLWRLVFLGSPFAHTLHLHRPCRERSHPKSRPPLPPHWPR